MDSLEGFVLLLLLLFSLFLLLLLLLFLLPSLDSLLTFLTFRVSFSFSFSWKTTSRPAPMPISNKPIFDTISQSSLSLLFAAAAALLPLSLVALDPTAIVTRILSRRCSIAERSSGPSCGIDKVKGKEEERKKARARRRERRVVLEISVGWERRRNLESSEYWRCVGIAFEVKVW